MASLYLILVCLKELEFNMRTTIVSLTVPWMIRLMRHFQAKASMATKQLELESARDTQPEQQSSPLAAPTTARVQDDTIESTRTMPPADAMEHLRAIQASDEQQIAANGSGECSNSSTKPAGDGDSNDTKEGDDNEEEVVVTLDEVLRQDAILTETADAVLGASSETDCSYPLGYLRQALYACLTCTPASEDESTRAGVCLVRRVLSLASCAYASQCPHVFLLPPHPALSLAVV